MLRTTEVLIVIIIILGAFATVSYFAVLPMPRQVSPLNLRRLALTTLESLDSGHDLSEAAFDINSPAWSDLQIALSASLPADIIYNLTIYNVDSSGAMGSSLYTVLGSISNAATLGAATDASSYMVASSDVTFNVKPEKINERTNGTLYILNCSDAYGWWITGYTAQSLAEDLNKTLSPYFNTTIMVQNTAQLGQVLNGDKISSSPFENVTGAVIVNTCGEAVPIPSAYGTAPYSNDGYAYYCYFLGQKVTQYNWTWASIVGWPLYYVSNNALFSGSDNGWGIYGMNQVSSYGLSAFLQGLDNQSYSHVGSTTGSPGVVYLSNPLVDSSNYYGIYPSSYQTSTRALPSSILGTYHLNVTTYVFSTVDNWNPGALYRHVVAQGGSNVYMGGFLAIGLTRTPDVRITALGLLADYKPRLYASDYMAYGTSRLVVLQLGLAGGT